MTPSFDDISLRNISTIIGVDMLTHKQITEQFKNFGFVETGEGTNKPDRIFHSL